MTRYLPNLVANSALVVCYFLAGKFGLSLAFLNVSASAVWPPTGIALAALLVWGYRLWPGIFLGAFLVNITTQGSVSTTLGIAGGNTMEALLGAFLVNRYANGLKAFQRAQNVFKFVIFAAILSTAASATIGVTSLSLAGFAEWNRYPAIWLTWWLGNMGGNLIVAPFLVIWLKQPFLFMTIRRAVEAAGLLLTVLLLGQFVFLGRVPFGIDPAHLEYLTIVPLLWGAFRFGEHGAVTSAFVTSAVALYGTLHGLGPFVTTDPNSSLLVLQIFIGTVTVTALVLTAVVSEQKRAEQRLLVQDAISRILAESPILKEAAPKIVQVLCERAGWEVGAVWNVDRGAHELACVEVWHQPWIKVPDFEAITRQRRFAPGIGLPGRVWNSGKPAWIPDVTKDSNFPRAPVAIKEGLHAAFGFPIKLGDETLGVIECFSREIREIDDHFLQMVGSIGDQFGQFVERKRAEEALRDSEGRLQLALAAGRMGAWEWNISANKVKWSASLEEIHGLKPGSFGGGFEDFKHDIHPEDVESVLDEIENTLSTHGDYHVTYRFVRSGEVRWLEAFGTLLLGADGQPQTLVGVCMDVTERKQAEAALRKATDDLARTNEELERRVQERTADLERANAALLLDIEEQRRLEEQLRQAQKMESIGTLAGGIAHDFNNILNIIRGYATLIGRHPAADKTIAESLKIIDEGIERGASVVRQLLTMARKAAARLESTNVNEIVSELGNLLRETFPKTIEVALDLELNLPPVMADANQINQALLNLCLNARDAMPDGGKLLVTTEMLPGPILRGRFQEAKEERYVAIKVTDSGLGMDEATRNRIFEPFFTTKKPGEGTGLGLSVVYGIITNHAGFIDVSSEPGCGTRFAVYLPIPEKETNAIHWRPSEISPADQLRGNGETILFVDDEVKQLRLMQQLLENFGYRVLTAKDGAEAVELHARHKDEIAAVVLDLGLPKINGWEALKAMKKVNPRVKPILASGYLFPQQEPETGEWYHVIMKPYLLDDILAKISEVIRQP